MKISKARIRQIIKEEIMNYPVTQEAIGDDENKKTLIKKGLEDYLKVVEDQDSLIKEIVFQLFNDKDRTNDDDAQRVITIQNQYKEFLMELINSL